MWPDTVNAGDPAATKLERRTRGGGYKIPLEKTSIIRTYHSRNSHTLLDQQHDTSHTCFPTAPVRKVTSPVEGISHLATTGLWQPIAVKRSAVSVVWITKSHSFPLLAHTFIPLNRHVAPVKKALVISGCETMGNTLELDKSRTLHASGAPSAIPQSAGEPVHAVHAGPGLQPAVLPVCLFRPSAAAICPAEMADVGQVLRNTSQGHGIYRLHFA
ncbi:uncharacterized protein B0T23DRAFT_409039 [Neurospora hispaniola]|uniref:Uncharacterized protein n=1 Tax=Neurospora hispaniola TaxID=588809 RepID=A0AAJ0IEE7_9PEZI|nr:hypothetical protein B0T23DRAFT_409039 [Neurospora hispaniola]